MVSIVEGAALFLASVIVLHAVISAQPNTDASWLSAIQAATGLLLVGITAVYVYHTSRSVDLQQSSLKRSSEEPHVRYLKQTLDRGPAFANHFERLRKWLPLKNDELIDDRAVAEFNTDAWHLDDLAQVLAVAAPQLPANIRGSCQHVDELIKQARHDLARLADVAGREKLRAVTDKRDATWDGAREIFAGEPERWQELLDGQGAPVSRRLAPVPWTRSAACVRACR